MKLWRENRINQQYMLENNDIIKRYKKSKFYNHERGNHWGLSVFISSPIGLNSSFEPSDFEVLFEDYLKSK